MPHVAQVSKPSASTANLGFEATPQSLSASKDNRWLSVPSPAIARRLDELTAPLMVKIKTNSTESRTLATLRDPAVAGLPKLLSGELRVPQCERTHL